MPTDIEVKYNPFDPHNPVTDPELFIGRESELRDIRYYLQQSTLAPRPFHLAILGARGSGKTSLLNMTALESEKTGLCVARIDLSELDVRSPLRLFFKIFDSVIRAVVSSPSAKDPSLKCFGGPFGDVYIRYLDTTSTFNIPDLENRIFTFPIQYAMGMAAKSEDMPISESAFKADLDTIHQEIGRPIALLFDECTLLADKRAELQILRNTFMSQQGYMLILSGTSEMFPVMNEVFSPIARQFRKLELAPFSHSAETRRAISVPLQTIGLEPGVSSLPAISQDQLDDIHELTGGRPHEIQLVCHCLMRRIQLGKQKQVELNVEVLDEVLHELRKGVDLSARPVIKAIRELDEKEIKEIAVFMQAADATLAQYHFVEAAFKSKGRPKVSEKTLNKAIDLGVFTLVDDKIVFNGDDFDRVYCRYYTTWRRSPIYYNFLGLEAYTVSRLSHYLAAEGNLRFLLLCPADKPFLLVEGARRSGEADERPAQDDVPSGDDGDETGEDAVATQSEEAIRITNPYVLRSLFFAHFDAAHCGIEFIPDYGVVLKGEGLNGAAVFVPSDIRKFDAEKSESVLRSVQQKIEILGGTLQFGKSEVKARSKAEIAKETEDLLSSENARGRREFEDGFFAGFFNVYTERHDVALAKAYADSLEMAFDRTSADRANNIGYFYMAIGELSKADVYLARSGSLEDDEPAHVRVVNYNLAVLYLLRGKFEESRARLEVAKDTSGGSAHARCLLVPEISASTVTLRESWNPRYSDAFKSLDRTLVRISEGTIVPSSKIEIVLTSGPS